MPPKSTSAASSSRRGKPSISRTPTGAKRGSTSADPSSSKRRRETTDTIELASDQDDEDLEMFDHSRINNDVTMLGSDDEEEQPDVDTNRFRRRQMQRNNQDSDADDSDRYQPQQDSDVEEQQDEAEDSDEEERPTVPSELLTRLLYEFFESDKTKITKDANEAVARYVDIFVREAIARSVVEREGGNGTTSGGGGFLEVEDLEKIAPQLLLDL
ncbi:CENP-S associating centromere protein X-domain-containing protein [Neurospora tetraspora]|uniref:CENP-S associating centromere protein X-domain-containing protein n=1 Tax=Neurospora tetraspora TaxID=94610 RepID=A0AAE0JG64_9PEZI|nr:CENP-S associating centromere protein X-domain-containing protein [Neurospora tetraspora]